MTPTRIAGTGRTGTGQVAWWSIAEGRRGRRWREAVTGAGGLRHSLLLETAPDGRFSHLELATPAGLLTLHPEGDGTLHGNILAAGGLRHVTGLPWDEDGLLLIAGSPLAACAAAFALSSDPAGGAAGERHVLRISPELELVATRERAAPAGAGRWRLGDDLPATGPDGLPLLADGIAWPMELAAE